MRKIVEFLHQLFLSVLIVGILSFMYISRPSIDYFELGCEKYFNLISIRKKNRLQQAIQ